VVIASENPPVARPAQLRAQRHGVSGLRAAPPSTTFQELAKQIDDYLRAQMPVWREKYPGSRR
jgi:hypothetical protein